MREGPEAEGRIRRYEQRTNPATRAPPASKTVVPSPLASTIGSRTERASVIGSAIPPLPINREIRILAGEHDGSETTRDEEARGVDGDLVDPASQFSGCHLAGNFELLGQHVELVVDRDGVTVDQARVGEQQDDDRTADRA